MLMPMSQWWPTIKLNFIQHCTINFPELWAHSEKFAIGPREITHYTRTVNNTSQYSYFHPLPSLWNTMTVFNLDVTFILIHSNQNWKVWENFLNLFDVNSIVLYIISVTAQDVNNESRSPAINLTPLWLAI